MWSTSLSNGTTKTRRDLGEHLGSGLVPAPRRKFATDLKDVPLPDLCALGGWKDAKTILQCYQAPDPDTMRSALANRRPIGARNRSDTRSDTPGAARLGPAR